jgi:hypothetical protein
VSDSASFLPSTLVDWLEACAKVLLIVGTVIGAGWAFFEYRHKEEQRRVEGSLGYVKRFSEGSLLESTKRIGNAWYTSQAALQRLQDSATEDEFRQRHHQLAMTVIERVALTDGEGKATYGIVADVDAVVAFFSELLICVKADLCDGRTAHAYFDTYAQRFYCLHEPYLSWKAANYSSAFGKDLAEFGARDLQACRKK